MIKICDAEIVIPLCLIYEKCLATGKFPEIWKKANFLPIHKKKSRQVTNRYYICGKIFEKLIFDSIYEHLTDNQLITPNQPGFRPGD